LKSKSFLLFLLYCITNFLAECISKSSEKCCVKDRVVNNVIPFYHQFPDGPL